MNHADHDGVTVTFCGNCVLRVRVGATSDPKALMVAAREGHWHLLPSLALAGANVAAKATLIEHSAHFAHHNVALVHCMSYRIIQDEDGFNSLHWAAVEEEVLIRLHEHVRTDCANACRGEGALDFDPTAFDRVCTAVNHCQGNNAVVQTLVDASANLDMRNWDGDSPSELASLPSTAAT
eukprot:3994316-Amphidinium_carterae.1